MNTNKRHLLHVNVNEREHLIQLRSCCGYFNFYVKLATSTSSLPPPTDAEVRSDVESAKSLQGTSQLPEEPGEVTMTTTMLMTM